MRKSYFSKTIKFFALALLGAATAIAAVAVLSSPASARTPGGGSGDTTKSWDTDNLRYADGSYNARSFNIPFHNYDSYSGVFACQKNVADAFFQAGGSVGAVNDFPYLDWVVDADGNESWAVQESGVRNDGCDEFVAQQDKMLNQIGSNGGYYLDLSGKLQQLSSVPSGFSVRSSNYVHWIEKGSGFSMDVNGNPGWVRRGNDYLERVDGYRSVRADGGSSVRAIYPSSTTWVLPTENSSRYGQFGARWHGAVSRGFVRVAKPRTNRTGFLPENIGMCPAGFHPRGEDSVDRIGSHTGRTLSGLRDFSNVPRYIPSVTADWYWCRSDLRFERRFQPEFHSGVAKHPQAATKEFTAYGRLNCYYTAFSSGPHGSSGTEGIRPASSGGMVCSYLFPLPQCTDSGRKRDFTETELKEYSIGASFTAPEDGSAACAEPPRCTANGSKRDFTDAELKEYTDEDSSFKPAADGTTPCVKPATPQCADNGMKRDFTDTELAAYRRNDPSFTPDPNGTTPCARPNTPQQQSSPPPSLPGFSDDACETANLQIYENRTAGSDAAPGVTATDRTLAAATGRTAWDLDITSPHPLTASPPRATGDASGCTDGSESRADHAATSGGAARSQSTAPSYASSVRTDTAAPPNDADGDIDYTGAVKNMAHRYASKVAENTCAAKEAEAELVLALGKARADMFSRAASGSDLGGYAARYAAAVESNRKLFSNASPKGYKERLEAVVADASVHRGYWLSWFNTNKAALISRATGKKTAGENFKSVLDTARANYKSTADAVALRSFSSGSCVAHWNSEIARIAGAFSSADTAFASSIATAKNAYHTSYDSYVQSTFSATTAGPTSSESVSRSSPFFITAISITSYYCKVGQGTLDGSQCKRSESYTARVPLTATERKNCEDLINGSETLSDAEKRGFIRAHCRTKTVALTRTITTAAHRNYSRTAAQNVTYTTTGRYNGATNPVSSSCAALISKSWTSEQSEPSWPAGHCTPPKSQTARHYDAVGTSPALPSAPTRLAAASYPSVPAAVPAHKAALLGKYNPANAARINLNSSIASARDTAADNLGTLTSATSGAVSKTSFAASAVPAPYGLTSFRTSVETEAGDYKTAYTTAYNNAYSQATTDMGTTATTSTWNNFDWRYETSTLAWGSYQEDTAATYSGWVAQAGETETDRDGTGCDLVSVAADGTVSVEATRLDYETSKYGKGNVFGTRTDAQRSCKIRRTRTPELLLEYQPSALSGTDTSKATAFWHVNYQPTSAAERFKLYDEAEVFALKMSLADRAPVLCYQPGEGFWMNSESVDLIYLVRSYSNGPSCQPKPMA